MIEPSACDWHVVRIEAQIRRRLRSRLIAQQKSRRNLFRKLVRRGVARLHAALGGDFKSQAVGAEQVVCALEGFP